MILTLSESCEKKETNKKLYYFLYSFIKFSSLSQNFSQIIYVIAYRCNPAMSKCEQCLTALKSKMLINLN